MLLQFKKIPVGLLKKTRIGLSKSVDPVPCQQLQMSTTVIDKETKRFGEWSENWWDVDGPAKGMHLFNNLRTRFIRDELLKKISVSNQKRTAQLPLEGFTIADVGCGAGILSESLANLGAKVTGIDATAEVIAAAREHAALDPLLSGSDSRLNYEHTTVEEHAANHTSSYDTVVCSEVIEHVDEKEFFVEQCTRLVKSGGSLFFTTQNRTLLSWAAVILWSENISRSIPRGTHHYKMFITPEELERILKKNDCFVRTLQGTSASPGLKNFYYTNNLHVCYAMHAIKK